MAGIRGMFDYSKPGKGVDKDAPQKKPFFRFFELFFRKFWKMMELNWLYLLFCLPIVTIGPATIAMNRLMKEYVCERPVFMLSDFWKYFKENFKAGIIMEILNLLIAALLVSGYLFYFSRIWDNLLLFIPMAILFAFAFIWIVANYYIFLMIPTVDMKLKPIIKNAIKLTMGLKVNWLAFIIMIALIAAMIVFFPYSFIVALLVFFSLYYFIIAFICYPNIEKYVIEPYYEKTGERRPDVYYPPEDFDEEEDIIFEDMGSEEPMAEPEQKPAHRGRVIK